MDDDNGLVFAYTLDGDGGGRSLNWEDVRKWQPEDGILWTHLDYSKDTAREWLNDESGIDPVMAEALMAEETRPRSLVYKRGMLVILRGVNLNPGADPEDMVAVRLWIDATRIVTSRRRRVLAIDDLRRSLETGDGPKNQGEFIEDLCDRLTFRMGTIISDLDDEFDALEEKILTEQDYELRQNIADIRRTIIGIRRYLAPQREVMARIHNEKVEWLDEMERARLRETADRVTRYVEDLDAIRDRATVTQEELSNRLAEQMNKAMYMLSIVTGMFLPLGLLTGLFGINVGGIPGTENPWAFTFFSVILLTIAGGQLWLFKRKRWM